MNSLVQSIVAVVVGLALTFFGVVHSMSRFPGVAEFSHFFSVLPTVGSVLFFLAGVVAAIAGLVILVKSGRRLRIRWQYLWQATSRMGSSHRYGGSNGYGYNGQVDRNGQEHGPEEEELAGGYR